MNEKAPVSAAEAIGNLPGPVLDRLKNPDQATTLVSAERLSQFTDHCSDPEKRAEIENLMRIPLRYRGKGLQNLEGYKAEKERAQTALGFGGSVFITGDPGRGKTHMAVGLMWTWLRDNVRIDRRLDGGLIFWGITHKAGDPNFVPIFLPATDLYAEIKETFDGKKGEREVTERYNTATCLVLDDMGAEQMTDWKRAMLYGLVDRRYRDMRQTIVTSNLNLNDVASLVDERIASRIVEMGAVIHLTGADFRLKMAK